MNVRYVHLIGEKREDLWNAQVDFSKLFGQTTAPPGLSAYGPRDHLRFIKEKRGEKIVAMEADAIIGWMGLFPDRDEGGLFYHLAGIEVHADHRGKGIGAGLMEEARMYLQSRKTFRLKFGTSPLLTHCAGLYVTRFGARYHWKGGVKIPDGRPWPYVSCECDLDDPLVKPLDIRDDEVEERSVVDWRGMKPYPRKNVKFSGPLAVILPDLSGARLAEAMDGMPEFLHVIYALFDSLFVHGYGFAWFDRTPISGTFRYFYVMKKLMTL